MLEVKIVTLDPELITTLKFTNAYRMVKQIIESRTESYGLFVNMLLTQNDLFLSINRSRHAIGLLIWRRS